MTSLEWANTFWWVILGGALIIGGILIIWLNGEDRNSRIAALEQNVEQLHSDIYDLRMKELSRARREMARRESRLRAEKQKRQSLRDERMELQSDEQVDFYKSVMGDIHEL